MKKIIVLIVFALAMYDFTSAQSPLAELDKVKEIKLLESNRDEVRKILADYDFDTSDNSSYYDWFSTKNARIEISYSSGNCADKWEEWNVAEWKVTEIDISPKNSIQIKDFGIDYSKFRKEKEFKNVARQYVYHHKDSGIAFDVRDNEILSISLFPSKNNYQLLCNNEAVRKQFLSKSWFEDELKDRFKIIDKNYFADVVNLTLNRTEITTDCSSLDSTQNRGCSDDIKQVAIFTKAVDPENDVLTYNYEISGGKIIGQGANVVWDLSGVKPGTYTIKAGVDDGCGICGKTITKTVVVNECSNCSTK